MSEAERAARQLALAYARASESLSKPIVQDVSIRQRIELIARYHQNRACVRFILACGLAKAVHPEVDIRKPYTEIGDDDSYSGRTYDESYIAQFRVTHRLPCNATTAFLTPAFRNRNMIITPEVDLVGRPAKIYEAAQQLLDDVHTQRISAQDLLAEMTRHLLIIRNEQDQRMGTLLAALKASKGETTLAAETIVTLIEQHMKLLRSSRLPVLVVAAAYNAAREHLGERCLPLESHNAADKQTGCLGDVDVTLIDDDNVVTSYEMKARRVTQNDIDLAVAKIAESHYHVDNYIFITTKPVDHEIQEYAASIHEQIGVEVVILDCIGFLRHFLHLFYRIRLDFLEAYQALLLQEPDSSVSQALKEAFLSMRHAAESSD